MDCFYCSKDQRLLDLMEPLAEMTWSDIYLFRDQKHRGRCVVAFKGHRDEIFQLSDEEMARIDALNRNLRTGGNPDCFDF